MTAVSVIIATYNGGARIGRAVQSVLSQDIAAGDVEIVIVDDGSTDDSPTVLEALAAAHPGRIVLARQANAGPAAARNHGMRIARGQAFAFLDDDDYWGAPKLRRQLSVLDKRPRCGLVYSDVHFVNDDGRELADYPRRIGIHHGDVRLPLFEDAFLIPSTVLLRRECIDCCGGFDESLRVSEDYELFLRISEQFHMEGIDQKLVYRVVRPDSLSRLDYALDARIDFATLDAFLARNPGLARANRERVRARLGSYRIAIGNRLLGDGRLREGAGQWLRGFMREPRVWALRSGLGAFWRGLQVRGVPRTNVARPVVPASRASVER